MTASSCYHIAARNTPPPPGGYPATFHLEDGGAYVKYGHQAFIGSSQRGDEYWTAEIITRTWHQAETGRIPISGAGYGGKFAGPGNWLASWISWAWVQSLSCVVVLIC